MTDAFSPPGLAKLVDTSSLLTPVGLRFTKAPGRLVTGTPVPGPQHRTRWGIVHGGVCTTAAETALMQSPHSATGSLPAYLPSRASACPCSPHQAVRGLGSGDALSPAGSAAPTAVPGSARS
jgi:hypothetical protein